MTTGTTHAPSVSVSASKKFFDPPTWTAIDCRSRDREPCTSVFERHAPVFTSGDTGCSDIMVAVTSRSVPRRLYEHSQGEARERRRRYARKGRHLHAGIYSGSLRGKHGAPDLASPLFFLFGFLLALLLLQVPFDDFSPESA
ncbi:putative transmembrane protein [Toxoplasma gondii FOU]|uniref:Putative transmembrane protein n=1 Tax=Toxoplasma gondii FOU TaxID=943167 RepID=A0A086L9W6_TOXGO|nr:putative transmembrane protein [Toxoplasma gondii FOU]